MFDEKPFIDIADAHTLAHAIVNTIREPLLVLDKDLRVVAASRSFYVIFQMTPQDVHGRPVYVLGGGEWDIPELRVLLESIVPQHTAMEDYEMEREFSGLGRRTMLLNARKVLYEGHSDTNILLAIEDITERRTVERAMTDLLAQKEVLLQEMRHRVANSLQIIASILLMKARTVKSEETRRHLQEAHQRVMSVASVQQHLQASGHGELIEIGPYLTTLCETLAASMIGDSRPIGLKVLAETGRASSNDAVSLGLIVTELVINALKHAFPVSKSAGEVKVRYEAVGTNWRLSVGDNGVGKQDAGAGPAKIGLGTSIVAALAKQLDARVEIAAGPEGMITSITHATFTSKRPHAA
jgi:two-component sensor histidine kinase